MLPHLDAAYRFARWLSSAPGHADDVVQEAVLRAFRGFDAFRGADAARLVVCHRAQLPCDGDDAAAAPRIRAFARETSRRFESPEPGPEDETLRRDASRTVARLLAALPEEHREVLVLREFEDMSYSDIARVIEFPIGTVMSRLARARAALKAIMASTPKGTFA